MKAETPPIKVRRATVRDAASLHLFAEALSAEEGTHARFRLSLPTLKRWLGEESFLTFLAERDGMPVGMAFAYPGYDTESGSRGLHLADLYVALPYRRQGIARSLLQELAGCLIPNGEWISWTMSKGNRPAERFYRHLGAQKIPVDFMALGWQRLEKLIDGAHNR